MICKIVKELTKSKTFFVLDINRYSFIYIYIYIYIYTRVCGVHSLCTTRNVRLCNLAT